jgi:hypothetical protein
VITFRHHCPGFVNDGEGRPNPPPVERPAELWPHVRHWYADHAAEFDRFTCLARDAEEALVRAEYKDGKGYVVGYVSPADRGDEVAASFNAHAKAEADGSLFYMERKPMMLEFFAYETIGASDIDFAGLIDKVAGDDDCRRYVEADNGAEYAEPDRGYGYTVIDVLPELIGLPFDNLALAYLRALRPSTIRVCDDGVLCLDSRSWRVTVHLGPDKRIVKIEQEVEVGYGAGQYVDMCLAARKRGEELPRRPPGNVIGHTDALAKVDFQ